MSQNNRAAFWLVPSRNNTELQCCRERAIRAYPYYSGPKTEDAETVNVGLDPTCMHLHTNWPHSLVEDGIPRDGYPFINVDNWKNLKTQLIIQFLPSPFKEFFPCVFARRREWMYPFDWDILWSGDAWECVWRTNSARSIKDRTWPLLHIQFWEKVHVH